VANENETVGVLDTQDLIEKLLAGHVKMQQHLAAWAARVAALEAKDKEKDVKIDLLTKLVDSDHAELQTLTLQRKKSFDA
jgi:hypothetical protein